MLVKDALHVSVLRSLYYSARFRGKIIILRGTRIRLDRGARIEIARNARMVIGKDHVVGTPASLDLRRGARLTVTDGRLVICRGARIQVLPGGHLEIGGETAINYYVAITCLRHITIGTNCLISWHSNIFDGNAHELIVDGRPRPRHKPVHLGNRVWLGAGATVLSATIGESAVVGTGGVVTSDVPPGVIVAGNPAQIVRKNVSWRL